MREALRSLGSVYWRPVHEIIILSSKQAYCCASSLVRIFFLFFKDSFALVVHYWIDDLTLVKLRCIVSMPVQCFSVRLGEVYVFLSILYILFSSVSRLSNLYSKDLFEARLQYSHRLNGVWLIVNERNQL